MKKLKLSVKEIVTNRIIESLENNIIPWRRSFNEVSRPMNWKRQSVYRGINLFLLKPGEYASYKEVTEAGGTVKKGSKAKIVVFFKMLEINKKIKAIIKSQKEKDNLSKEDIEIIPCLRFTNVFQVGVDTEGLEVKNKVEKIKGTKDVSLAKEMVEAYLENGPKVALGNPAYSSKLDTVYMLKKEDFINDEFYYSTYFHELVHSTMHEDRCDRKNGRKGIFGSEDYAKEELVAEMGANMLSMTTGISQDLINEDTDAYIQSWLRRLKNDPNFVIQAATAAQKATDFIKSFYAEKHKEEIA